jgi:hypothetical protein
MSLRKNAAIAVIGAGAAGLVTLRVLRAAGYQVVVFESSNTVGGTWSYEDVATEPDLACAALLANEASHLSQAADSTKAAALALKTEEILGLGPATEATEASHAVQSSIYANLRTNLPKQVMQFPDDNFPDELPSFLDHWSVQRYLLAYAQRHDLMRSIRLETRVQAVEPLSADVWSRYRVRVMTNEVKRSYSLEFDAVCVCNGHYTAPQIPAEPFLDAADEEACIPGLTDGTFCPGVVRHSHFYREPKRYTGLRVLCLGAGPSGIDISLDIAQHAKCPVYLSSRAVKQMPPDLLTGSGDVVQVPSLRAVVGPRRVLLADGSLVDDLDVIMLCTGYRYVFPFLTPSCGVSVTHQGRVVEPLYRHLIPVFKWTLPFVGIPFSVVPFPLFEYQAHYLAAIFQGRVQLPDTKAMLAAIAEERRIQQEFGQQPKHFHRLGDRQWAYNRELADASGVKGPTLAIQSVYNDAGTFRKLDPKHYRFREYRVFGDGPEDWEVQIRVPPASEALQDSLQTTAASSGTRRADKAEEYSTGL